MFIFVFFFLYGTMSEVKKGLRLDSLELPFGRKPQGRRMGPRRRTRLRVHGLKNFASATFFLLFEKHTVQEF